MANSTGAFGLRPVRHLSGAPWNGATIDCYVSSSYATALFVGDPVLMSPTSAEKDPTGKRPTINKSAGTAGTIIFGVITEFEPDPDNLSRIYLPASTGGIAKVCVDNTVVYQIRGSGLGTPTSLYPGQNAVCVAGSGSTVTGLSGTVLDEGGTTALAVTQNFTLWVLGISDVPDNTLDDYAMWDVMINTGLNATGDRLGVQAA